MKNIAISLDAGTPEKRNAITNLFAVKSWPYWHWIDDFWIVQIPDELTPKSLLAFIEALPEVGPKTILLFEFPGPITYWGRAKTEAWNWLISLGKGG